MNTRITEIADRVYQRLVYKFDLIFYLFLIFLITEKNKLLVKERSTEDKDLLPISVDPTVNPELNMKSEESFEVSSLSSKTKHSIKVRSASDAEPIEWVQLSVLGLTAFGFAILASQLLLGSVNYIVNQQLSRDSSSSSFHDNWQNINDSFYSFIQRCSRKTYSDDNFITLNNKLICG